MNERKYWIRKEREPYLLLGVIITCIAASLVSAFWHFSDRTTIKRDVRIGVKVSKKRQQGLRDLQFTTQKMRAGTTSYYSLGGEAKPFVPLPGGQNVR